MPDHSAPPAMLAGFFYPYGLTDKQIILDCPDDIGYKKLSILSSVTVNAGLYPDPSGAVPSVSGL